MTSGRLSKYRELQKESADNQCSRRILTQLGFLLELSAANDNKFDDTVLPQVERLYQAAKRDGAITFQSVTQVENDLSLLQSEAREYGISFIIQPPMGLPATKDPTYYILEVRRALELLERYPDAIYFEPRTMVYQLLESYQPLLLSKVKEFVQTGRWEVGLTSWSGMEPQVQSLDRACFQLCKNREYITMLFDLPLDRIQTHFELEGLGCNSQMASLLSHCHVPYNYRYGSTVETLIRLLPQEECSVVQLNCNKKQNYNLTDDLGELLSGFFDQDAPKHLFCAIELNVEDITDTIARIEILREIAPWPFMPTVKFRKVRDYFYLQQNELEKLPEKTVSECFSDIDFFHKEYSQQTLAEEELIRQAYSVDAMATMLNPDYERAHIQEVRSSFGRGESFPESKNQALLISRINREHAMNSLCLDMNTLQVNYGSDKNTGFELVPFSLQQNKKEYISAGTQKKEPPFLFTVFNTSQYAYKKVLEVEIKHWKYALKLLYVIDGKGKTVPFQIEQQQENDTTLKIIFSANLPAFGYMTYRICKWEEEHLEVKRPQYLPNYFGGGERLVLENNHLRACFSAETMLITSFVTKKDHREFVHSIDYAGAFQLLLEEHQKDLSPKAAAAKRVNLNTTYPVYIKNTFFGRVRCWVEYEIPFEDNILMVKVILDKDSQALEWNTQVKWRPNSLQPYGNWKLTFSFPLDIPFTDTLYRTPWSILKNPNTKQAYMAADTIVPVPNEGRETIQLMAKGHHSFSITSDKIVANLFTPHSVKEVNENGLAEFSIGVGVGKPNYNHINRLSNTFLNTLQCVENSVHGGLLPPSGAIVQVESESILTKTWATLEETGMYLQFYNPTMERQKVVVDFVRKIGQASLVNYELDSCHMLHTSSLNQIDFSMDAQSVVILKVLFH